MDYLNFLQKLDRQTKRAKPAPKPASSNSATLLSLSAQSTPKSLPQRGNDAKQRPSPPLSQPKRIVSTPTSGTRLPKPKAATTSPSPTRTPLSPPTTKRSPANSVAPESPIKRSKSVASHARPPSRRSSASLSTPKPSPRHRSPAGAKPAQPSQHVSPKLSNDPLSQLMRACGPREYVCVVASDGGYIPADNNRADASTKPMTMAADVVNRERSNYIDQYFTWAPNSHLSTKPLQLEYPAADAFEAFLPLVPKGYRQSAVGRSDAYNPIGDVVATVDTIIRYLVPETDQARFGDESTGVLRRLVRANNRRLGHDFRDAVATFNTQLTQVRAHPRYADFLRTLATSRLPHPLVSHVLFQTYSRTAASYAEALTNYEAFSSQVYGEVNGSLVHEMLSKTQLAPGQVFVDMGCGIGNVVLQVAAEVGCESHGIEIMERPSFLAMRQAEEFAARMQAYGLPHGKVVIRQGDFLNTPALHPTLSTADVVLVNNYAFSSGLNQQLLQLFLDLKDGAQIISLKSFVPTENFKITSRNAGSPESILQVKAYPYWSDAVSWTNNGGTYYIHTVDRGPLQAFWARQR
ncbi:Nucleosomal histone H3-Lys79 methylase [Dimargaris verticillata]|uniref:Histone-lysine N-methyltransferase, H3 lysine-79 specific n=1 Tax=Dimargaris verticillata TaxID=2761393 RepID=A0A9W8B4Q9_9FUNG|nr:Nucleosomal histone H3-Lys79 methylase [Dimargaris verticillata]